MRFYQRKVSKQNKPSRQIRESFVKICPSVDSEVRSGCGFLANKRRNLDSAVNSKQTEEWSSRVATENDFNRFRNIHKSIAITKSRNQFSWSWKT